MSEASIALLAWSLMGYGCAAAGKQAHATGAYLIGLVTFAGFKLIEYGYPAL